MEGIGGGYRVVGWVGVVGMKGVGREVNIIKYYI